MSVTDAVRRELDEILSEPLSSVLDRERHTLDRMLDACGRRVVLFGGGNLGRRALRSLRGLGLEPLAFADNNPKLWGTEVEGVRVLAPAQAAEEFGTTALFLVTIWTADHRCAETLQQLRRLGVSHISPGAVLYWRFPEAFLPHFAQDRPSFLYEDAEAVRDALTVWSDDASRLDYLRQIRWRSLGDAEALPPPQPETYFPSDLVALHPDESFVDCGAFDGDTLRMFLNESAGIFRSATAIEADGGSFCRLESYVNELNFGTGSKIELIRCAVGKARGTLRFDDTKGVNSCVSEDGVSSVDCLPLDEIFDASPVTYIKMDIEGSEYDAVLGSRKIIQRDRPVLAVCVYHNQNHIWRLPLLIREALPEYCMYLRMYECDGWQTVAYAIPPERVIMRGEP